MVHTTMDNLTHTLVGVHLAKAGWTKKYGKGVLLFMILMSNIPDLDLFWAKHVVGGDLGFLSRRMLTHSVVGIPLLSLFFGFLFHLKYKTIPLSVFFKMGVVTTGVHVFFDLVNSYGVVLLYPFLKTRFELAWIFIIDLIIWGLLVIPLFLIWPLRKRITPEKISQGVLILLALYVGFCGLGRAYSSYLLRQEIQESHFKPDHTYVYPEALGPHRFRGVVKVGEKIHVYQIPFFTHQCRPIEIFQTDTADPDVAFIRQTPEAKQLEWFFKTPVWEKVDPTGLTRVFDLRFRSSVLFRESHPFSFLFKRTNAQSVQFLGSSL